MIHKEEINEVLFIKYDDNREGRVLLGDEISDNISLSRLPDDKEFVIGVICRTSGAILSAAKILNKVAGPGCGEYNSVSRTLKWTENITAVFFDAQFCDEEIDGGYDLAWYHRAHEYKNLAEVKRLFSFVREDSSEVPTIYSYIEEFVVPFDVFSEV